MSTPTVLLRWILFYLLPAVLFAWFYETTRPGTRLLLPSIRYFWTIGDGSSSPGGGGGRCGSSRGDEEEENQLLLMDHREDHYDWKSLIKMIPSGPTANRGQNGPGTASSADGNGAETNVVHVVVLVHGWLGSPLEMDSIKESLEASASALPPSDRPSSGMQQNHQFVVHSAACNEGRTNDGIQAGGRRLAREINSLVAFVARDRNARGDNVLLTLSLVGNSLGGLYARQALAEVEFSRPFVRPVLFVTTATPHLGVSRHTYLPLPRVVEYPIARFMDRTGRDLFRFTPALEELTSGEEFLTPLLRFHSRVAYVNVYGTDFQVPTPTAGFWSPDSDSLHEVVVDADDDVDDGDGPDPASTAPTTTALPVPPMIVMRLATSQRPLTDSREFRKQSSAINDDLSAMYRAWSERLDGLGWTKVLVDVRGQVPAMPGLWSGGSRSSSSSSSAAANDAGQSKDTWTARELLREFGGGLLSTTAAAGGRGQTKGWSSVWLTPPALRIPLGHTVMIANAKDGVNRWITRGGKPVMDYLAASMVRTLTQQKLPINVTADAR